MCYTFIYIVSDLIVPFGMNNYSFMCSTQKKKKLYIFKKYFYL